jgi:hypothetical protein
MKSLYTANVSKMFNPEQQDLARWGSIFGMISANSPIVDRCSFIEMPYRFKLYQPFEMPRDLAGFTMTYEDCCLKRTQELVEISRRVDKPITVFYSGGIDSTLVLISLMKYLSPEEYKERVQVALSWESIHENSNFYYNYIRPVGNIVNSNDLNNMFNGSSIMVGGEHNDQLFGSDVIGSIFRVTGFPHAHEPYTREKVTNWLGHNMSPEYANFWFDLLDNHIKTQAPCEVTTNFQFWWWLNFSFKWQNVFFRMMFRVNESQRANLNQEYVDTYFHHFYSTTDFQKWAMLNPNLKIKDDWRSYKWEAKRLIYEFNKDQYYYDNKIKSGSLNRIFTQRKSPKGLTSDYEFLDTIDPAEFYNPNNSFK